MDTPRLKRSGAVIDGQLPYLCVEPVHNTSHRQQGRWNRPAPLPRRVRQAVRLRHFSTRSEEAYVRSVKRFILFHGRRHRTEMGERQVATFASRLAVEGYVTAATQNQAPNALVFLYPRGQGGKASSRGGCLLRSFTQ